MPSVGLERRVSGRKAVSSIPALCITLLELSQEHDEYPWEKNLTLIFKLVLCVVWKTRTGVSFSTAYTKEKINIC